MYYRVHLKNEMKVEIISESRGFFERELESCFNMKMPLYRYYKYEFD